MTTNIIMVVRDRYKLTKQALDSLDRNTDRQSYNLTVVDDGSSDFRVRNLFLDEANTRTLLVWNSGHVLSQLKNLGVAASEQFFGRGEYLCLCDNDVFFAPRWLDTMAELAFSTELLGFKLWGGQQHPYHFPLRDTGWYKEYEILPGTHWFMKWQTWQDYGPLDRTTASGVCRGEDGLFCGKIRRSGGRIAVPEPHVVHDCGWTNTDGTPAPGIEVRVPVEGVYHE